MIFHVDDTEQLWGNHPVHSNLQVESLLSGTSFRARSSSERPISDAALYGRISSAAEAAVD